MPAQAPFVQTSPCVQASPSLQAAPSGLAEDEQTPVDGLHVLTWHGSSRGARHRAPPVQTPALQVSLCVQALPSLQAVPSDTAGLEHLPVAGAHVPAAWHWSEAAQVTGLPAVQTPAWQVSPCVQELPSSQAPPVVGAQVPSAVAPPATLHAVHGAAQAVAQQTPLTQKPLAQSTEAAQGRPAASWENSSALARSRTGVRPARDEDLAAREHARGVALARRRHASRGGPGVGWGIVHLRAPDRCPSAGLPPATRTWPFASTLAA